MHYKVPFEHKYFRHDLKQGSCHAEIMHPLPRLEARGPSSCPCLQRKWTSSNAYHSSPHNIHKSCAHNERGN